MDRAPALAHPPARAWPTATGLIGDRRARGDRVPADEATIARLMAAIAAGDRAALWRFREVADAPVRARLRATLHRLDVPYEVDDLDGMVTDAVLAIADIAAAWRPGGAPPWVWAHHRVAAVVHRFIGIFATSLDALADAGRDPVRCGHPSRGTRTGPLPAAAAAAGTAAGTAFDADEGAPGAVDPTDVVHTTRSALRRLVLRCPKAALLDVALSEAVSERDAALWLAFLDQREAGNRHPAVTVGAQFGMRPEAVRKAVQRTGHRLRRATEDARFAALASLPVFAGHGRPAAA